MIREKKDPRGRGAAWAGPRSNRWNDCTTPRCKLHGGVISQALPRECPLREVHLFVELRRRIDLAWAALGAGRAGGVHALRLAETCAACAGELLADPLIINLRAQNSPARPAAGVA